MKKRIINVFIYDNSKEKYYKLLLIKEELKVKFNKTKKTEVKESGVK